MNESVKTKWIDALTNGKYQQGREVLRTPKDTFCCLGVLCDLYAQEHADSKWGVNMFNEPTFIAQGEDQLISPPNAVLEWADLDADDVTMLIFHNDPISASYDNNDVRTPEQPGLPFTDIAELIETYL